METLTDYAGIAARYDLNPVRARIPLESGLPPLSADGVGILDLACGTGAWLAAHQELITTTAGRWRWHGLDAEEAMLARASAKVRGAALVHGTAEALPFSSEAFDHIVCRYAFHHFRDKEQALKEIARVAKPGGRIRFENLCPEAMPDWWLYRFFPATREFDSRRFWPDARLTAALTARGLQVSRRLVRGSPRTPDDLLLEAMNRETSQLVHLADSDYESGIARLRRELDDFKVVKPGRPYPCGTVLHDIVALKPGPL